MWICEVHGLTCGIAAFDAKKEGRKVDGVSSLHDHVEAGRMFTGAEHRCLHCGEGFAFHVAADGDSVASEDAVHIPYVGRLHDACWPLTEWFRAEQARVAKGNCMFPDEDGPTTEAASSRPHFSIGDWVPVRERTW